VKGSGVLEGNKDEERFKGETNLYRATDQQLGKRELEEGDRKEQSLGTIKIHRERWQEKKNQPSPVSLGEEINDRENNHRIGGGRSSTKLLHKHREGNHM